MPFWTSPAAEPKRQHRFLVMFSGIPGFQPYIAKAATKPSFEVSETEHKFLGNTYYYPGSLTWNEVTITLVNTTSPDGQALLLDALEKSGYLFPPEQREAVDGAPGTLNKTDSTDSLGYVTIREIDGDGKPLDVWTLRNAFIKSCTFGDLDYDGDDLLNIEIGMRYDWAQYTPIAHSTLGPFGTGG